MNTYAAFEGHKLFSKGSLSDVVLKIKKRIGKAAQSEILIFSSETGKVMDFNFQGTEKDVSKRLEIFSSNEDSKPSAGPGRPRLGVISREVSLLPRHWEWLATQTGGASGTLRKLVEEAKKKSEQSGPSVKQAQERTYKFLSALAGDLEGYEEALRALFKKDEKQFLEKIQKWPRDVRDYAVELSRSE